MPDTSGLLAQLINFGDELRREGLAVGTAELLDACAALEEIEWQSERDFRETLAATLAKSQQDRHVFEQVFDRFFFRATELAALERGSESTDRAPEQRYGGVIELDALRQRIGDAIRASDESALRDLARLAITAFKGRSETSGVIGVDVQRIRRELGLRTGQQEAGESLPHYEVRRFEQLLRRELERAAIERNRQLPLARPLNEFDRALPTSPTQDLAAIHRTVAQLKRRLATQGAERRGRRRHAQVDVRRTLRASLQSGGVPVELKYRPRRPRRPEIYVLCDVSTSVSSASVFFLSVLHALHDTFRKLRSFVFIERVSEVTEVFATERNFEVVNRRITEDAGVADRSGYTDYGRVWEEFLMMIRDDLTPRSSVIVLGDARTNGREPRTDLFAQITQLAGRTFWLNPEPRLYWNYGDSVISAYGEHCELFECWTQSQLEQFVKALTSPALTR